MLEMQCLRIIAMHEVEDTKNRRAEISEIARHLAKLLLCLAKAGASRLVGLATEGLRFEHLRLQRWHSAKLQQKWPKEKKSCHHCLSKYPPGLLVRRDVTLE